VLTLAKIRITLPKWVKDENNEPEVERLQDERKKHVQLFTFSEQKTTLKFLFTLESVIVASGYQSIPCPPRRMVALGIHRRKIAQSRVRLQAIESPGSASSFS